MMGSRGATAVALVMAGAVLVAGRWWGSAVAGGADSYGYVSQAEQWRRGRLTIDEEIARASPWPLAIETWAPLGYRAAPGRRDAIVPLYAPGLPMLMALFQAVGGFCAAFLVVPICGAMAVGLTYVFGRQLFGSLAIALAAAALVATSPIFLYQLMNPMTDVPVTAAIILMLVLLLADQPLAGIAAGVAVLIRPNLLLVVVPPILWLAMTRRRPLRFIVALAPFVLAVAWTDARLYGAPWISGYGEARDLYAIRYAVTNLKQFSAWLFSTQTPFVLLGLTFFAAPGTCRPALVPRPRLLLGGTLAAVALSYIFYLPFDAWWYLRFLLPMWPVMMVATAAGVDAMTRRIHPLASPVALALSALIVGVASVATAAERSTFDIGRWERRYIDVARFVAGHSEPGAVVIALQHTGTLRLYAGRLTLRFDQLDPAWLDRTVQFLADNGRHPFIVVEDAEIDLFRRRFGDASAIGRLDWPPVGEFERSRVAVYDAVNRAAGERPLAIAAAASRRSGWRCDPPYAGTFLVRLK